MDVGWDVDAQKMSAESFSKLGMGDPDVTEIVPFAHSLEKLLFPSFFSVQDPADRNRHSRHLDVIPTLIARF